MKILFCTNVFEVVENGPVKFANLLLQLNELYPQHELRILTEDISAPRPYVHQVPMPPRWKASLFSQLIRMWVYHREAMRLRHQYPFDVLVYNNALVGLWSAHRFRRTVGMINDDNLVEDSSEALGSVSLKNYLKHLAFRLAEKRMAHRASQIIVNSDYLKNKIITAYQVPPAKIQRLYKGIELVQPSLPAADKYQSPVRILFVKNDYRRGGLAVLAQALQVLPFRFELVVIGSNPRDQPAIELLFKNTENTTLTVLGKQPQEIVFREMEACALFCVPSYKEALGVANLEALARARPVITTQVGGIPEVLDQGTCGWMVPPGNASALARAIEECLKNPALRTKKIQAGLQQTQRFSKEQLLTNFLSLLAS
ncbi:glycosyltransferase family 4 protein [Rhabdobacter roseus]|uniref:Glycosyltransferase involved in cell wall biosynthesis n=1 Tax=Rhabdobacter roseus TaxID=1655419 RepID=A0A840TUM3_9BACT|nr:glycosyltransferase family 4 protein [Rhabdobacter roseus]MBB5284963.1 glycosyltransferase involved in cell wall biosynthesis [Rhabdobacter roseus]